jgi:antitoxin (DNA-binding transcriptional repressor) of toxin-antitoxin stability system
LIERALAGEEIVISRGATPAVKLVPIPPPRTARRPGSMKGKLVVGEEFFEPMPEEELAAWER